MTVLAALAVLAAVVPTPAAEAPRTVLSAPREGCSCHDAFGAKQSGPAIDLLGWEKDGPHRKLGCLACHPGSAVRPHHPDRVRRIGCESCHAEQARDWKDTVHGRLEGQNRRVNGCLTCHAEHPFFRDSEPRGRFTNTGLLYTCADCHAPTPLDPGLAPKPNDAPPGKPWPSSVHGMMSEGDRRFVAACASCHGAHRIFASSDRRSRVAPGNLQTTCGGCHGGIGDTPIRGRICRLRRDLPAALTKYFDIWYIWTGGAIALWVIGVGGAMAAAAVMRRRGNNPSDRRRTPSLDKEEDL